MVGAYIKREDAINAALDMKGLDCSMDVYLVRDMLKTVPAADVRPAVHGVWVEHDKYLQYCSRCMYMVRGDASKDIIKEFRFCPNCGAEMDGGTE